MRPHTCAAAAQVGGPPRFELREEDGLLSRGTGRERHLERQIARRDPLERRPRADAQELCCAGSMLHEGEAVTNAEDLPIRQIFRGRAPRLEGALSSSNRTRVALELAHRGRRQIEGCTVE